MWRGKPLEKPRCSYELQASSCHFYMAPMQDAQLSVKSVHVVSGNCIPFSNKVVSKN